MQIRQLAVHYDLEADRLLLRVRSADDQVFGAWLTRRLTVRLWPLLWSLVQRAGAAQALAQASPQAVPTPEAASMLARAARERSLQQADFSQPFHDTATERALGIEPLLAHTVQLTPRPPDRLHLVLRDARGRSLGLELEAALATAVRELMAAALRQADWGIAIDPVTPEAAAPRVLN
jgi:hypothetical protein